MEGLLSLPVFMGVLVVQSFELLFCCTFQNICCQSRYLLNFVLSELFGVLMGCIFQDTCSQYQHLLSWVFLLVLVCSSFRTPVFNPLFLEFCVAQYFVILFCFTFRNAWSQYSHSLSFVLSEVYVLYNWCIPRKTWFQSLLLLRFVLSERSFVCVLLLCLYWCFCLY